MSLLQCPVKTCDHHWWSFENAAERAQHIFKHFSGMLHCGFCKEETVSFSNTPHRVDLFMSHLIQIHGANSARFGKGRRERPAQIPSLEEPIASCSVCTEPFNAQGFYAHLPGCILREVTRNEDPHVDLDSNLPSHDDLIKDSGGCPEVNVSNSQKHVTEALAPIDPSSPRISGVHSVEECEETTPITEFSRCLSLTSSHAVTSSEEETDWTDEQTSRESSPGESQVPRRLSPAKRNIVDAVMKEFQFLSNQVLRSHTTGGTASGSSSSATIGWSSNASIYSTSSFVSRKRSLSGGGSTPPDDEEDDTNKRRRPDGKTNGKKPETELRYACPYYKRNPGRHQTYTSCRDPGFVTVARLK
jgi:hypothetical protein